MFNQLSVNETDEVLDFLTSEVGFYHVSRDDLTDRPTPDGPSLVHRIELMEPVKSEVLEYLDNGGLEPERFAKASIIRPDHTPKDVMEYKIGPLPLSIGDRKPDDEIGIDGDDSPVEGVIMLKLRRDGGECISVKNPDKHAFCLQKSLLTRDQLMQLRLVGRRR